MKKTIALLFTFAALSAAGQTANPSGKPKTDQGLAIQTMASFPGGRIALDKYMKDSLKWKDVDPKTVGNIFVEVFIEADGSMGSVKIMKGLCAPCDKEALRLINAMPRWKPATQNGLPVRERRVMPVRFGR